MSETLSRSTLRALLLGVLAVTHAAVPADDAALNDPTRPSGWRVAPEAAQGRGPIDALRLQGTFNVGGERSALLSGRRVSIGDRVAGAQVVGIEKNKVMLRIDGETLELAAAMPPVKSPTGREEGESR